MGLKRGRGSLRQAGATLVINDGGSGQTTIATAATTARTLTLPDADDTLVGLAATQTLTNKTLTSPTLTTPSLGVATATSINKVAVTAPATGATLTIADGKTLTASNTLTLAGTDGSTITLGAGGTVVYETAAQTLTNKTLTTPTLSSPSMTTPSISGIATFAETLAPSTPSAERIALWAFDRNGFSVLRQVDSTGFTSQLNRDAYLIAKNTSGGSIAKGEVVYITGATGNFPTVSKARANSSTTMPALGVAGEAATNNSFLRVLTHGVIESVDTSAFAEGAEVFVSSATAGALTATRPTHPNLAERIGTILVSHAVTGQLEVNIRDMDGDSTGSAQATYSIGTGAGSGAVGLEFKNSSTGTLSWTPTGSRTITIPDATTTMVGTDTTQTLSAKTLTSPTITSGATVRGDLLLQNTSGSQPTIQLSEDPDNGTNKITIQAPATLGADYTLTLPTDDGGANQVLTSDGSGGLSWSTVATTVTTTRGDLIKRGASADERLAIGTANQVLKSDGTDPSWTSTLDLSASTHGIKVEIARASPASGDSQNVYSGAYTPTYTRSGASFTTRQHYWLRVGNSVTVWGYSDMGAGGSTNDCTVTLPITPSSFSGTTAIARSECTGICHKDAGTAEIQGTVSGTTATIIGSSLTNSASGLRVHFSYRIS